jgi:hypothetical protein
MDNHHHFMRSLRKVTQFHPTVIPGELGQVVPVERCGDFLTDIWISCDRLSTQAAFAKEPVPVGLHTFIPGQAFQPIHHREARPVSSAPTGWWRVQMGGTQDMIPLTTWITAMSGPKKEASATAIQAAASVSSSAQPSRGGKSVRNDMVLTLPSAFAGAVVYYHSVSMATEQSAELQQEYARCMVKLPTSDGPTPSNTYDVQSGVNPFARGGDLRELQWVKWNGGCKSVTLSLDEEILIEWKNQHDCFAAGLQSHHVETTSTPSATTTTCTWPTFQLASHNPLTKLNSVRIKWTDSTGVKHMHEWTRGESDEDPRFHVSPDSPS